MKITERRLRRIIKNALISEMPVTKSGSYFSRDIDTRRPELQSLAEEVDSIFQEWDIDGTVELFDSGYHGISIEFRDFDGIDQDWIIVDQPGKVGLEDQSMGYIFFGPGGKGIQKSNAWIWEQVPYLGRKFGDANMRDDVRQQTYNAIIDTIDDMIRSIEMGSDVNEYKLRKHVRSKLLKEYSSGYSVPDFQTVDDMEMFLDELEPDDPVETDVEDPETFEMMIPAGESMEEQEWYEDSRWFVEPEEKPEDPYDLDDDWEEQERLELEEEEREEAERKAAEEKYEAIKEKLMNDAADGGEDWAMDTMSDASNNPSMWQDDSSYNQYDSPADYVRGFGQDASADIADGYTQWSDDPDVRELWATLSDKDPYNTSWWQDGGRPSKTLFKEIIADNVYGGIERGIQKYIAKYGEYIGKENPSVEAR